MSTELLIIVSLQVVLTLLQLWNLNKNTHEIINEIHKSNADVKKRADRAGTDQHLQDTVTWDCATGPSRHLAG